MKTDKSIRNITIASVKRNVKDMNSWSNSRIADENNIELAKLFKLAKDELPVFEIKSEFTHTLISTRQILEFNNEKFKGVSFEFLDDVIYGDFKGRPNKPEMTIFRVIDIHGDQLDFQMETGKASIGLIYSINTIRQLKSND